jgi:8-oxo-dGTP pyrophosphatase MutT (NUDIX family)
MRRRLYTLALMFYRRLPRKARRQVVRFFAPSYTVGSICVIERPDGAILLAKQAYRDNWGLPGGLLNRREDPADAARREVYEEVGLTIRLIGEPAVVVDPIPQRIDLVFRARPTEHAELENVRPRSPEIREVRWFAPDALPELQFETADALVALARSSASPQAHPLLSDFSELRRPTR